jgi:hypothetical protein
LKFIALIFIVIPSKQIHIHSSAGCLSHSRTQAMHPFLGHSSSINGQKLLNSASPSSLMERILSPLVMGFLQRRLLAHLYILLSTRFHPREKPCKWQVVLSSQCR